MMVFFAYDMFWTFPRSFLIWEQLIFKLFFRPNCTKSVAWPPLRAIQNAKSTIQFQSYIHDININIWIPSYMIRMLIKILLSPTSVISKLLYQAPQLCQIVILFLIKQFYMISMWQTLAQAEKQRGEPVLEQQQPCQVWESLINLWEP